MPMPALNPWDQLTPEQQMSLVQNIKAGLPQAGGAGPAPASPLQQRMGNAPMPPGWPGAGVPVQQMPQNPNLGYLGGQSPAAGVSPTDPERPGGQLVSPITTKAAAGAIAPPAGAANAGQAGAQPPAGLPLYLPKQTILQKRDAARAADVQVPYAPGHGPWDNVAQDPHATTAPGGGKSPSDYVGQKDAGNPNGGQPPDAGEKRGQLADIFGIPGAGMMNPRSMFKPGEMAPRGTAPVNPLQAAGSPQSALPGGTPSLADLGKDPSKIAAGQQAALTTAMPELHNQNYLQPIEPMTLKGEKSEGQADQKSDVQKQVTQAVPQTEFDQALQRVIQGTPGMSMMREDLTNLHNAVGPMLSREAAAGPGARVDLSPLMALSDTWFGGDLSKGYQRPTDRLKGVADLAKTLTGGEGQLTDSEVNFLRSQLQDKYMSDLATGLTGKREVSVGAGMGAGGMMNPLEFMRFAEEMRQHGLQREHEAAQDAGKYAQGGEQYAELRGALKGIDQIAKNNHAYRDNYLPGYGGKLPVVGGMLQNFHNPTSLGKSEEGKDLDRYLAVLTNAANHMDFGVRITDAERRAMAANLATAQGQGPRQALKAISDFQAALRQKLEGQFNSMTPQAKEQARKSGALMPEEFNYGFGIGETPASPQKRAPVRAGGAPAEDAELPVVRPRGKPDAPDMPAAEALRQGGSAASKTGGKTGSDIIPEASKDVDELRRQAKERARALGGQ